MPRTPTPPKNCSNPALWALVASYARPIDREAEALYRRRCKDENHPVKIGLQFDTEDYNLGRWFHAV